MSERPRLPSGEPRPRYDLEALLGVAVRVFSERGYDGTSMEELARASGLSKSSIYHHVDSKERLLRMALERALDPLLASLEEDGTRTGRAADRLRHLLRRDVEVLVDRLPYVTLLLRVRGNTDTERWALEQRRRFDHAVAALVEEAARDGDLRADLDGRTTARLVFGLINSVVEWYRPGRDLDADRLADEVVALVFEGIGRR